MSMLHRLASWPLRLLPSHTPSHAMRTHTLRSSPGTSRPLGPGTSRLLALPSSTAAAPHARPIRARAGGEAAWVQAPPAVPRAPQSHAPLWHSTGGVSGRSDKEQRVLGAAQPGSSSSSSSSSGERAQPGSSSSSSSPGQRSQPGSSNSPSGEWAEVVQLPCCVRSTAVAPHSCTLATPCCLRAYMN